MKFIPEYKYRKLNGVYIIKNNIDNRVYIGLCKNFYKRFGRHKSALNNNKHLNIKLLNFVNKYGIGSLSFDILEIMYTEDRDTLIEREMLYILQYDSIKNGFNIILDSRSMSCITYEQRKMGFEKLKHIERSEEYYERLREGVRAFYKNTPLENRRRAKWTDERKQKRKDYIKLHPERYANRRLSSGNKTTREQGRKCSSKINEQIAYLIKLCIIEKIPRRKVLERYNITLNIYKDIQRGRTWNHIRV